MNTQTEAPIPEKPHQQEEELNLIKQKQNEVQQLKERRRRYQSAKETAEFLKQKRQILELRELIADTVLNDPNMLSYFLRLHPNLQEHLRNLLPLHLITQ